MLEEVTARGRNRRLFLTYADIWSPDQPKKFGAYPWQADFHNAGADNRERLLMKANRVGGTTCAAAEVACHATGHYPLWWQGKTFTRATKGWVGGESNEAVRDVIQEALLGPVEEWGTGWIPREFLAAKPKLRQAGVADVVDSIRVKHKSGGISVIGIKTYEQEREKWQGRKLDYVWLDEQPSMEIFTEALTRIMDSGGVLFMTFTPLKGENDVVLHFRNPETSGIYLRNVTWEDAPHLTVEQKEQFWASYPEHERETRAKGLPMMGTGIVFPVRDEDLYWDVPAKIPAWWARINGIDFGIDHPAAGAFCAWDRDRDTFYVIDCYRMAGQTPVYHAAALKKHGDWIPCAWPRDGFIRDKGSGVELRKMYRNHGLIMLPEAAAYHDERGEHVEPAVIEMLEYMRTARFKVARGLSHWFEEKRMYHRENGMLVKQRDDILAATRYAFVSRRLARTRPFVVTGKAAPSRPILGARKWRT